MREALNQPGFMEGPVADLAVGRIGPKALGYIVGKKAATPAGSTVVFDIAGAPAFTYAVSVPPEGRATLLDEIPSSPTTKLTFDRRTYTRLAGGRWTGDDARKKGSVAVAGDETLGNRIVDNMAFTI
jgi:hypothetical protein